MSSGDDPDACIPTPFKDFIFDLHQSVRCSQIPEEQSKLYNGTFRELHSKYFSNAAWPSPEAISDECAGEALFLAFYSELTQRYLHSGSHVKVHHRIQGWHTYTKLFDALLEDAKDANSTLYILPEWSFDILHEFVYQFQGFCQFRTQNVVNASKSSSKTPPAHVMDAFDVLSKNTDVWAPEKVFYYLHKLTSLSQHSSAAYRHLSLFASVVLSRLECLLGDYTASLAALRPVCTSPTNQTILDSVIQAKISVAYHAGVSYLALRRYKDAARVLGDICAKIQRAFKTGQLKKQQGSADQNQKQYDRMIALLAIVTHICSGVKIEDSLERTIREKHGKQLAKIDSGEEAYDELFCFACPKFISAAVPDYNNLSDDGGNSGQEAYKLQVEQFLKEMDQQRTLGKLRSYMKLYTSIKVDKLAAFNDAEEEEFLARMLCCKHKMRQLETTNEGDPLTGDVGTALDIHYYITGDMVHVGAEEKIRRFENFFIKGIKGTDDILRDLVSISTEI